MELYHFCDEKAMTWYDFAEQILIENNLLESIKLVKSNNYRTFANRPKNSVLIKSKYILNKYYNEKESSFNYRSNRSRRSLFK